MISKLKLFFSRKHLGKKQKIDSVAEKRFEEHQAGWTVLNAGESIAELNFIRIDPPFYLFQCFVIEGHEAELALLKATAFRVSDSNLSFRNQMNKTLCVKDKFFFVNISSDLIVSIRDMRKM
ncbi:MAG: hypothetical protein LBK60_11955 [Verrucomicrobiales bacterium]|jgi:hypothetical protein|nr:hypothetical protein [Verrucomicrobiales bacterium]